MHSILALRVVPIQASAQRFGGHCVWRFSQLQSPVKGLICNHRETGGGVCEMLSAKWLEEHAKGGSIVNWMMAANGEGLDSDKIRYLMQLFAIGCGMRTGALSDTSGGRIDQNLATDAWLRMRGVVRRRQISGGKLHNASNSAGTRQSLSKRNFSEQISQQIISSPGSYKMIGIHGDRFAHAMAAWSDQDVSFFDPNFGEFWFARPNDFLSWFPLYWQMAGYAMPALGLNEGYSIQEYGLPSRIAA